MKTFEENINEIENIQNKWLNYYDKAGNLCDKNGKILEHETRGKEDIEETKIEERKLEIKARLNQLSEDILQHEAGEIVPNYPERLAEFRSLHNEIRALEGKEPRKEQI